MNTSFLIARSFSMSAVRSKLAQAPIQVFGLEGRYAHALFSAAVKQNKLDAVEKDMVSFEALLTKDKTLAQFISNPTVKRGSKRDAIEMVAKKTNFSDLTKNTFVLMAENGRVNNVKKVLKAYKLIMSAQRGEVACVVTVAKPLEGSQRKDLEDSLKGFLKPGEKLYIDIKTDPTIIGGMIVQVGDKYVDMSIATKMRKFEGVLREAL